MAGSRPNISRQKNKSSYQPVAAGDHPGHPGGAVRIQKGQGGNHMKVPFLLGRFIFGGFFLYNGINHFRERKTLGQYAQSKNIPQPEAMVMATGTALIAGGASILLGV